ncbi:MAG: hypothetical protein ACR2J3_12300 [Aridibacter sp.]
MKNKFTVLFAMCLVLFVTIGCSFIGSDEEVSKDSSGKSGDTKTSETKKEAAPSGEVIKVGIPECDELVTYVNDNTEEIESSYAGKAALYFYKNYILESIREGVGNASDEEKAKSAKTCKTSLEDLKKSVNK